MLGNVVAAVALTVLIYERTGSPALAASVMALAFLPYLLGGVLLGAAPDRWPARRVLVCCDLLSAVIVAAMVLPGVPVVALLALLFANGLISPVYQGVRSSVLPQVLSPGPDYVLARSMLRIVAQSAQIAGYGAGGLLLAFLAARGAGLRRRIVRGLGAAAADRPAPPPGRGRRGQLDGQGFPGGRARRAGPSDRQSTRLNSSHMSISYAVS